MRKEVSRNFFLGIIELYPGDLTIREGEVFEGDSIIARVDGGKYYFYF